MISPTQCKMARAALGWSVRDLGARADVNFNTVVRFENGADLRARTLHAMELAMRAAGIEFFENGAVRLVEPSEQIAA